jgi:acetoin utilization deacetylase AcuC-like enzyme
MPCRFDNPHNGTAMTTAYYHHADARIHDTGRGHPECSARMDAIADALLASGVDAALQQHEAPLVERSDLELAHTANYVAEMQDFLQQAQEEGGLHAVDPDTIASAHTWDAVRRGAGAAVAATDAVIDRSADNAFVATRPPGHHATRERAMGFCFFNNVAVAARHALDVRGLRRVAVVDFDVHHGNGTEDILAGDSRVQMVSFFQHPFYPYSGTVPRGDNMLNIPVPAYTKGPAIRELIEKHWIPRLEAFEPQMLFFSAGFDAHRDDDLGQLGLVEADFEWITKRLMDVADVHCEGRIVSCLEGGYNLQALGRSVVAHLRVLAGINA